MNTINKLFVAGIFLTIMFVGAFAVPGAVQAQYYGPTYHSYQMCLNNNLYWYDSYGNRQDVAQYCTNGCYNNSCQNNYNNNYNYNYGYNNSCTYHAYKLCAGNGVYWYDSCGNQQDLYYNCVSGQTCQYGQCVNYVQPAPVVQPAYSYVPYSRTACYNNSIYWYDSLGVNSGLYKNCTDNNSCTADSCSASKCLNILKCDGSTCASGSADYNTYCQPSQPAITTPAPVINNNPTTNPTTNTNPAVNTNASGLSISLFVKQDAGSNQWQKSAQINPNGQAFFMISVTNTSTAQADNVSVSANIPSEVSSLGNLQVNGITVSGDIVSGINIGSVAPSTTKLVTFEGKTQSIPAVSTKSAYATIGNSNPAQTDSVSINFTASPAVTASVSSVPEASGFWGFLKRWYLWILVGLTLIFLFVIVYRRISSTT
ncbi:MAG: hypothetical protein WC806_04920 [Candidatus Gracilibacteria bacterium]|jgi:hypothetical protein